VYIILNGTNIEQLHNISLESSLNAAEYWKQPELGATPAGGSTRRSNKIWCCHLLADCMFSNR